MSPETQEYRRACNERRDITRKEMIREAKRVPCNECGGHFPSIAKDLHHPDPSLKLTGKRGFTQWSRAVGVTRFREELEKCEVLCANCHRIHHWKTTS